MNKYTIKTIDGTDIILNTHDKDNSVQPMIKNGQNVYLVSFDDIKYILQEHIMLEVLFKYENMAI